MSNNTFDDFVGTAKKCMDYAARKTSEAIDYSKKRIEKAQINNEIRSKYEALGRITYRMSEDKALDESKKIKTLIYEISKLKEDLADIDEILKTKSDSVFCQQCGSANDKSADYCSKCGKQL